MAQLQIIVGTVMGTALEVAEAVKQALMDAGHSVRVNPTFQKGDLAGDEILLLCTSNTGMGDLPQNILPFYLHLTCDFPRLAGCRYGVINLGDSSYPNFAQAGQRLDEAMADLGAVRVGEPLVLDAIFVDDPVGEAVSWALQWNQQL